MHLEVRIVLYAHVKRKKNYLYILNIWTQNNLLLMQSACYIMHGLSLSQRSFTPCCASPPTAPRRQADTHTLTHTLHLVLTVIYSTLALPPTLSVCSQTATQMSERERRRGRQSGWGKEIESERHTKGKLVEWSVNSCRGLAFTGLSESVHICCSCMCDFQGKFHL